MWRIKRDNAYNVFRTEASSGKTLNKIAVIVFIINITDRQCIEPTLLWIKPEAERLKVHNRERFHSTPICL